MKPCEIYLDNLAYQTTEKSLEVYLGSPAGLREIELNVDLETQVCQGNAILTFINQEEAELLRDRLSGKPLHGRIPRFNLRISDEES